MNAQREIIYKQRREVLDGENIHDSIINMIEFVADNIPTMFVEGQTGELNIESLNTEIINVFGIDMLDYIKQNKNDAEKISEQLKKLALEIYSKKEEEIEKALKK